MPPPGDSSLTYIPWPSLQDDYADEFGQVDAAVYELAGKIWPWAQKYVSTTIYDLEAGQRLMMKAVAIVSRRLAEAPDQMTQPKAYLARTFQHLVLEQLGKQSRNVQLEEATATLLSQTSIVEDRLARNILLHEIMQRANPSTREILGLLILGYSFEEIGKKYGKQANAMRSKFSKALQKLIKQVKRETLAAERKIVLRRRQR